MMLIIFSSLFVLLVNVMGKVLSPNIKNSLAVVSSLIFSLRSVPSSYLYAVARATRTSCPSFLSNEIISSAGNTFVSTRIFIK